MPRGVKLGARRGRYKRVNKSKLRKLVGDVLAGHIDRKALAEALESANRLPERMIAERLRQGGQFDLERLARAIESLGQAHKQPRGHNPLPVWMVRAALKHLSPENGGKGEPVHKALRVPYPYTEHPKVRAYHRQLVKDYGQRSKRTIERQLNALWPQRTPGIFREIEKAIKESLSGHGVPLEVWRIVNRRKSLR